MSLQICYDEMNNLVKPETFSVGSHEYLRFIEFDIDNEKRILDVKELLSETNLGMTKQFLKTLEKDVRSHIWLSILTAHGLLGYYDSRKNKDLSDYIAQHTELLVSTMKRVYEHVGLKLLSY